MLHADVDSPLASITPDGMMWDSVYSIQSRCTVEKRLRTAASALRPNGSA